MIEHGPKLDNPAYKLSSFYEDLVVSDEHGGLGGNIDTHEARAASQTFRDLGPVTRADMKYWIDGWGL